MLSVIILNVVMLSIVMLSVIMLSVVMLSVVMPSLIMLCVVMLNVVAPSDDFSVKLFTTVIFTPLLNYCVLVIGSHFNPGPIFVGKVFRPKMLGKY